MQSKLWAGVSENINAVGPYENVKDEKSLFNLFVKRIEEILADEGKLFWKNNDKKTTDNDEDD